MRGRHVRTVAGGDDDAAPQVAQIDIVEARGGGEGQAFALHVVDVDTRLLVGADDQAFRRVGGVAPDGGVIGGVGGGIDRIGFRGGGNVRGDIAGRRHGGAAGKQPGEQQRPHSFTRTPPKIV